MQLRRATVLAASVLASLAFAASAEAWAPASSATIHPGVNTETGGGSCTSNFIFTQGSEVYIGQAAHCSGTGAATETDGCDAGTLDEGAPVQVDGASQPGTMVYNSWVRMQERGETDPDACAYNDLALVRLAPADVPKVNPSVPFWGGPTGLATGGPSTAKVVSYGNSTLRQGIEALRPKEGSKFATEGDGWSHRVFTVTPGIPGDSGSGYLDRSGAAFGVLSTVALLPVPASNGVGDLARELAYARQFPDFAGTQLVPGTEPFRGPLLP